MYTYSKLQKFWHKTYQHINISRPLYLRFIPTSTVSEDMVCSVDTFDGHSNVLRLVKVFTVPDLPIHAFSLYVYFCQNLCNLLYTHTHTHTHIYIYICIYIYIYVYICIYIYIYVHICIYICKYIYIYICIYIYIYIFTYIYIYIYIY